MLQTDVGDDGDFGAVYDVGGIEGTAHADFKNHDVAVLFEKILHGDGGHQLKLAGVILHGVGVNANLLRDPREILARNIPAVHLHALAEVLDIGRGIESGPIPRMAENRVQHGTGGALAVASGDMDELQLFLRISDGM